MLIKDETIIGKYANIISEEVLGKYAFPKTLSSAYSCISYKGIFSVL